MRIAAMGHLEMEYKLTPAILLEGYKMGIFPMAEDKESPVLQWFAPDPRAIMPLDQFHASDTLQKLVRQGKFDVATNRDFESVMRGCAAREETWISEYLISLYTALHQKGHAHSIECRLDGELAGGLYGVAIGGAFFGESMFHRERDASKVALVHLVELLKELGYVLLDIQFMTDHLARFGAIEIPRDEYEKLLADAVTMSPANWPDASSR